jgi:hypothetical protein
MPLTFCISLILLARVRQLECNSSKLNAPLIVALNNLCQTLKTGTQASRFEQDYNGHCNVLVSTNQ